MMRKSWTTAGMYIHATLVKVETTVGVAVTVAVGARLAVGAVVAETTPTHSFFYFGRLK